MGNWGARSQGREGCQCRAAVIKRSGVKQKHAVRGGEEEEKRSFVVAQASVKYGKFTKKK